MFVVRNTVDHLVVHRGAKHSRIAVVSKKGCFHAQFFHLRNRRSLQIHRRSAHAHNIPDGFMYFAKRNTRDAHLLYLSIGFNQNSHRSTHSFPKSHCIGATEIASREWTP